MSLQVSNDYPCTDLMKMQHKPKRALKTLGILSLGNKNVPNVMAIYKDD